MKRPFLPLALAAGVAVCLLAACGNPGPAAVKAPTPTATASAAPSPTPEPSPSPTPSSTPVHASPSAVSGSPGTGGAPAPCVSPTGTPAGNASPPSTFGQGLRQWAQSASATTSYSPGCGLSWNASQAAGPPNANCSDDGRAWASAAADTVETLTLTYTDRVVPTAVRVIQSYNPGHISKVTVSGGGQTATVYTGPVDAPGGGACVPLEIAISNVTFAVDTVAVTVDQTKVRSWSEIDAVELVGTKTA